MSDPASSDYRLVPDVPAVDDFVRLRRDAGLTPMPRDRAEAGLPGTWRAAHVVASDGETVAMGRIVGDGACYFHVVDMAVLPGHQRRGLGDRILAHLLERVRDEAGPGAYVTLMADPPGVGLYRRHGFRDVAGRMTGMDLRIEA